MADTTYIAYVDHGNGVGAKVNPNDFDGGEEGDDFQYALLHRTVVPLGDPDASIAMGKAPVDVAAEETAAELAALRARVAELEAAAAASAASAKPAATGTGGAGGSGAGGGGGGASTSSTPATGGPGKPS